MIIQSNETKTQPSLIDLLGGNNKTSSKNSELFSKLLASFGMQNKGDDSKITPSADFKAVIDPKNSANTKTSPLKELQMLLGNSEEEPNLVSNTLLDSLTNDQVRTLMYRAKNYLKNEITAKSPEYQADPKTLPKTLSGLIQLAGKLGLEPQSITLTTLISDPEEQKAFAPELLSKPLFDAKKIAALPATSPNPSPLESITQLLSELKNKDSKNTKTVSETSAPSEEASSKETAGKTETQPLKALLQMEKQESDSGDTKKAHAATLAAAQKEDESTKSAGIKAPEKPFSAAVATDVNSAEAKSTETKRPDFKTADLKPSDIKPLDNKTAETKPFEMKPEENKPLPASGNSKIDGLIALLQGDPAAKEGRSEETGNNVKDIHTPTKGIQVPQADAFEVKTKEAQQSMRLFATDLKEAAENYKPPFTRLTMKLNPEKLGEVEVTLIQRGNNVHVNIQSSNANSIAFLAHNATELKTQLANQGITNTTMNFMSGGDSQGQQSSNQQQHEQRHSRFQSYESLKELELNDEQLSALEIIIPHYA
ncbi:MAG: flagellar hook-length control protein FliK [Sulfuricurvum sp.]|nr:flagellar hook-length control protein FliK [Sulfuricurvum sp.]